MAFSCPENYVPVSPVKDSRYYSDDAFCVMKYEAKLENGKAVSKPGGIPISKVSYAEASELCRLNGSRYSLMGNEQWQVLAQNIELQNENWSKGTNRLIGGNMLNCGVSVGISKEASRNDKDDCAVSECNDEWDYKKRTHVLPNDYVIWDVCGNVGEMMRDQNIKRIRKNYNQFNDYAYLANYGDVKRDFGPKRNYKTVGDNHRANRYWGLGRIKTINNKTLIVRGGQGQYAGVFSADLDRDIDDALLPSNVGFRCVYLH